MRADPNTASLPGARSPAGASGNSARQDSSWPRQKAFSGPSSPWQREMERAQLQTWFQAALLPAPAMPAREPLGAQVSRHACATQALGAYRALAHSAAPQAGHSKPDAGDHAAQSFDAPATPSRAPENGAPQAPDASDKAGAQEPIGTSAGTARKARSQHAGTRQMSTTHTTATAPAERGSAGLAPAPVAQSTRPESASGAPPVAAIRSTPVAPAQGPTPDMPVCLDAGASGPQGLQASASGPTSGAPDPGHWLEQIGARAQVGVHCETAPAGLSVWLAVPAGNEGVLAQISLIASGLQRLFAARGERLLRVVCNGVAVWKDGAAGLPNPPGQGVLAGPSAAGKQNRSAMNS